MNYIGHARSNYFYVNARERYVEWVESFGGDLEMIENDLDKAQVGFVVRGDDGGIPTERMNEETEEYEPISFFEELSELLAEGEVAIVQEAGHEGNRYVYGAAFVITTEGVAESFNITNLALDAAKKRNPNVTACQY